MSLDLGAPALEIAIALAFVFFLLSLVVSAVNEGIAGVLNLRAKTLKKGLKGMLGDEAVVRELLDHALIRTDLKGKRWHRDPSYISPRNFALAFTDLIDISSGAEGNDVATVRIKDEEGAGTHQEGVKGSLNAQLTALTRSSGVALPGVPALEKWFDESMERVSGWYKRQSQLFALVIAVVVAIGLNVSALKVADHLASEPTIRAAVVAKAEAASKKSGSEAEAGTGGGSSAKGAKPTELKKAGEDMETAVSSLSGLRLPIFWAKGNGLGGSATDVGLTIVGWLITIIAISLGAPFWFDALNKLANLRMAGKKPEAGAANPT